MGTITNPTASFGHYLHSQGYRDSIARYRDNSIQIRKFNPDVQLESPWIIGSDMRAMANPRHPFTLQGRYGFLPEEISGFAGERVPDRDMVIGFGNIVLGGSGWLIDTTPGDRWTPLDQALQDLAYVSNGLVMAVQDIVPRMLAGQSGGNEAISAEEVQGMRMHISNLEGIKLRLENELKASNYDLVRLKEMIRSINSKLARHELPTNGGGKHAAVLREIKKVILG